MSNLLYSLTKLQSSVKWDLLMASMDTRSPAASRPTNVKLMPVTVCSRQIYRRWRSAPAARELADAVARIAKGQSRSCCCMIRVVSIHDSIASGLIHTLNRIMRAASVVAKATIVPARVPKNLLVVQACSSETLLQSRSSEMPLTDLYPTLCTHDIRLSTRSKCAWTFSAMGKSRTMPYTANVTPAIVHSIIIGTSRPIKSDVYCSVGIQLRSPSACRRR